MAKIVENILKDLPSANVLRGGHEKRVALKPDPVPEPGWSLVPGPGRIRLARPWSQPLPI